MSNSWREPRLRARARSALAVLAPFAALLYAAACDSKAVAVNDCRDIETARCVAARSCDLGVDSDEKEDICRRYARDNCEHGLSTGVVPKRKDVESCLRVIKAAGDCAKDGDIGGDSKASACSEIGLTFDDITVCQVVEDPTQTVACSFLLADPPETPEPEPDDGGTD